MASKMATQHLQRLREELAKVDSEIRSLEGRREGLKLAISVVNDEPAVPEVAQPEQERKSRAPIKDVVLRILTERGEQGANALDVVDLAKAQGIILDRNSVSSLLSRFKRDGVLEHDGKKYTATRPFPRKVKDAA